MKIAILMEGETERSFLPCLREFLSTRLPGSMPTLISYKYDGRIPKQEKLRRVVETLLRGRNPDADHVIALTDVYTGSTDFQNAEDAKRKMQGWVGPNDRFHAHVALHDFEAWLLPYWPAIQELARHNRTAPAGRPESVNHSHRHPFTSKRSSGLARGRGTIRRPATPSGFWRGKISGSQRRLALNSGLF